MFVYLTCFWLEPVLQVGNSRRDLSNQRLASDGFAVMSSSQAPVSRSSF